MQLWGSATCRRLAPPPFAKSWSQRFCWARIQEIEETQVLSYGIVVAEVFAHRFGKFESSFDNLKIIRRDDRCFVQSRYGGPLELIQLLKHSGGVNVLVRLAKQRELKGISLLFFFALRSTPRRIRTFDLRIRSRRVRSFKTSYKCLRNNHLRK